MLAKNLNKSQPLLVQVFCCFVDCLTVNSLFSFAGYKFCKNETKRKVFMDSYRAMPLMLEIGDFLHNFVLKGYDQMNIVLPYMLNESI